MRGSHRCFSAPFFLRIVKLPERLLHLLLADLTEKLSTCPRTFAGLFVSARPPQEVGFHEPCLHSRGFLGACGDGLVTAS